MAGKEYISNSESADLNEKKEIDRLAGLAYRKGGRDKMVYICIEVSDTSTDHSVVR